MPGGGCPAVWSSCFGLSRLERNVSNTRPTSTNVRNSAPQALALAEQGKGAGEVVGILGEHQRRAAETLLQFLSLDFLRIGLVGIAVDRIADLLGTGRAQQPQQVDADGVGVGVTERLARPCPRSPRFSIARSRRRAAPPRRPRAASPAGNCSTSGWPAMALWKLCLTSASSNVSRVTKRQKDRPQRQVRPVDVGTDAEHQHLALLHVPQDQQRFAVVEPGQDLGRTGSTVIRTCL